MEECNTRVSRCSALLLAYSRVSEDETVSHDRLVFSGDEWDKVCKCFATWIHPMLLEFVMEEDIFSSQTGGCSLIREILAVNSEIERARLEVLENLITLYKT